jgi:uncharacterized protein
VADIDHPLRVAERLFDAITAGRLDDVRSLYADDAVIWHSNDGRTQGPDENVATLRWATTNLRDMRYTDVRRSATDEGFVQQHVLRAVNRRGDEVAAPACIVCQVRDGRITRLDEYLDAAVVARMVAR